MPLHAIVFDFDGVIADTEPLHLQGFQEALATIGVALTREEYLERYLGYTDREGFVAVAADRSLALSAADVDALIALKGARMQTLLAAAPSVFPGVSERVRDWSTRLPVAVASGALRAEIDTVLRAAGLTHCFRAIVSADDPVASKPSPEPYQLALRRLGEVGAALGNGRPDPGSCVAIEDSIWGIAAAKAAGLRVIAVTSSYDADALGEADLVVPSVADVEWAQIERLLLR